MKKIVLICGAIAGLIVSAMGVISTAVFCASGDFENGMIYGYTSMIIAFSLIFVGIKNFRDKYNNGVVSFGKAFKVGLLISLVASTCYVISWLINFHFFMPDFYEKYSVRMLDQLKNSGASAATINEKSAEMMKMTEWSKNEFFVIIMTYVEILPVGLIVTLIAALILKRKNAKTNPAMV
ncbi:MAG: DUF4199 domain-containing protein [Ferruginibacter sp.]